MVDYNFGGSEEENAEVKKLEYELVRFLLLSADTSYGKY